MDNIVLEKQDINEDTGLVLLCCDAPQHYFLIEQMISKFNVSGIVIERNEDQMKTLFNKKKYRLWAYRKYHSKRRALFGHSNIRKQFFKKNICLNDSNSPVLYTTDINDRSVISFLNKHKPELTICVGTMYIRSKVRTLSNHLINLHSGILPNYKGNQCIFFALFEKNYDKVGATIHLVTKHLDGGPIIDWVKPSILIADNDETLYCKSFKLCVNRLIEIIHEYNNGHRIIAYFQEKVQGKTYSHCDRSIYIEIKYLLNRLLRTHNKG